MRHTQIDLFRTNWLLARLFIDKPEYVSDPGSLFFLAEYIRRALNWGWLKWHVSHDRTIINPVLEQIVELALKAKGKRLEQHESGERGEADQLLLTAALLSGNPALTRKVASTVAGANPRSKQNQYAAAVAGVLAAILLGDDRKRDAQLSLLKRQKSTGTATFPSPRLVHALIWGSDAEFNQAIASGVEKYWGDRALERSRYRHNLMSTPIEYEDESRIGLDLQNRNPYWMWPYSEAAFARVAVLHGRDVRYDDFWFPLAFVTGFDTGEPPKYVVRIMPEKEPVETAWARRRKRQAKAMAALTSKSAKRAHKKKQPRVVTRLRPSRR